MLRRLLLWVFPLLLGADSIPSYTVQTIAGTDFVGDGGPAASAILSQPEGLAIDVAGNIFFADADDNRVRKITPDGIISTVAGTGSAGFSGDGGPATSAQLDHPYGIALDRLGNLYIADLGNARVRQVGSGGTITTIAGGGNTLPGATLSGTGTAMTLQAPRNLAFDSAGNLYIADFGANQVYELTAQGVFTVLAGTGSAGFSGDGGLAMKAQLSAPAGITVDAGGTVFIADSGNNRVRKVSQGVIGTAFPISAPTGLAMAANGSVYVAANGYFGTFTKSVAGSPAAQDLAVDSAGNIYLTGQSFVQRIKPDGSLTIIAGNGASRYYGGDGGAAAQARLHQPSGIAFDDLGDLYIADSANHRIRKILANGVITTFAGTGVAGAGTGNGLAMQAQFNSPLGVAVDSRRNVYVADTGNNRVVKITPTGAWTLVAGGLNAPAAVAADASGNLFIADTNNDRVLELTPGSTVPSPIAAALRPQALALDPKGAIFIAESTRVSTISKSGTLTTVADGLNHPGGLAILPDGRLAIAETGTQRVLIAGTTGVVTAIAGSGTAGFSGDGGPASLAQFQFAGAAGVAVDNQSNLYVADTANQRIRELSPSVSAPAASTLNQVSVVNAASLLARPVAPSEIVTIFGSGFDATHSQVLFDGNPTTIFFANGTQINALAPAQFSAAQTNLTVLVNGSAVATAQLNVVPAAPALFVAAPATNAAALNQDGSYNSDQNPAPRNSVVSLFATGWNSGDVSATVGGYNASVLYAGPAPGFAGLMQVNIQVPAGFLPPGNRPVVLTVAGVQTQPGVTLAVE